MVWDVFANKEGHWSETNNGRQVLNSKETLQNVSDTDYKKADYKNM